MWGWISAAQSTRCVPQIWFSVDPVEYYTALARQGDFEAAFHGLRGPAPAPVLH